jgi:hypothetical protein
MDFTKQCRNKNLSPIAMDYVSGLSVKTMKIILFPTIHLSLHVTLQHFMPSIIGKNCS